MDMAGYIDEVKFKLTGGVLELEIDDAGIQRIIEHSFRELQRYINNTQFVTVPFQSCIDVSQYHISDVRMVFASGVDGVSGTDGVSVGSPIGSGEVTVMNAYVDPMAWSAFYYGGSGQISNYTQFVDTYYAYAMTKKGLNTGDVKKLVFNYNKAEERLYINQYCKCKQVTIEYVPRFDNVDEITNDGWIDILVRYSVANLKVVLGRVRSRFTQNNALWSQDGETLLNEGNAELTELRTYLDNSASILRPR